MLSPALVAAVTELGEVEAPLADSETRIVEAIGVARPEKDAPPEEMAVMSPLWPIPVSKTSIVVAKWTSASYSP